MNNIQELIEKYKNIRDKMGINLLDMVIDDLSKIVPSPPDDYNVRVRDGVRFVSIGYGEDISLSFKYGISIDDIYRIDWGNISYTGGVGWISSICRILCDGRVL